MGEGAKSGAFTHLRASMKRFTITERRMRGPRKSRVRVGPWLFIWFVVLSVLAAIVGRWIERHYEPAAPPPGSSRDQR
jgi:hypothetical protein